MICSWGARSQLAIIKDWENLCRGEYVVNPYFLVLNLFLIFKSTIWTPTQKSKTHILVYKSSEPFLQSSCLGLSFVQVGNIGFHVWNGKTCL